MSLAFITHAYYFIVCMLAWVIAASFRGRNCIAAFEKPEPEQQFICVLTDVNVAQVLVVQPTAMHMWRCCSIVQGRDSSDSPVLSCQKLQQVELVTVQHLVIRTQVS